MAGKISPGAAIKVTDLESYGPRVARLHSLVEQFAAEKNNPDNWQVQIKRLAGDLRLKMMTAGDESLSQICGSIVMVCSRSGNHGVKTRALREFIASLKFQIEVAIRSTLRDDEAERGKEDVIKQATKEAAKQAAIKQAASNQPIE
jgi:hypothetical protein